MFSGESFLTSLFSIGNTTVWGAIPPGSAPASKAFSSQSREKPEI